MKDFKMGDKSNKGCTPKPIQVTPGAWVTSKLPKGMK